MTTTTFKALLTFLLLIGLAVNCSKSSWSQSSTWLRDDQLKVSFAYRPPWVKASASESATIFVVNWLGKTGGLVATCYLQAYSGSSLSRLDSKTVHEKSAEITKSIMNNMKTRYSEAKLISSENKFVDGYPVVFLVRDGHSQGLNDTVSIRAWSLVTAWRIHEIQFECASPIPHQFPNHEVTHTVENEIMRMLGTLHFER